MRPPVAAIMHETITIGVILASNSTPAGGTDAENPPPGILNYQKLKRYSNSNSLVKRNYEEEEEEMIVRLKCVVMREWSVCVCVLYIERDFSNARGTKMG